MQTIKDELQHIILGDEPPGQGSELKKTQTFLRVYAQASLKAQKQQYLKSNKAKAVLVFAERENLFYKERFCSLWFVLSQTIHHACRH
jgi:hypothetical protein